MKTLILKFVLLLFLCTSCGKKKNQQEETNLSKDTIVELAKKCATMDVLTKHLQKDSLLKFRMQLVEDQSRKYDSLYRINTKELQDSIKIPVVVNVIYSNPDENISDEQIASQLKVLNEDFNKKNPDIENTPEEFTDFVADVKICFKLVNVNRKQSNRTSWGFDDEMKFSSSGGIDVADPSGHLNIWICNIGQGVLGYAQFPGDNPLTDGIVISPQFFGTTGFVQAPFDKGRTATHEVGHWLNLRHIWGDGDCSVDDFVVDTPLADRPNNGCPPYPTVHCNSNDMTMNYMDYVNDECMFMFTEGQKIRMRAVFYEGGPRNSFIQ